jgi:hypothetical protein
LKTGSREKYENLRRRSKRRLEKTANCGASNFVLLTKYYWDYQLGG